MNTQNTDFFTAPADEMLNDIRYSKAQQITEFIFFHYCLDVHSHT